MPSLERFMRRWLGPLIFLAILIIFGDFGLFYELSVEYGPKDTSYKYRFASEKPIEICALNGYVSTSGQFFLGAGVIDQSPGYIFGRKFTHGVSTFLVAENEFRTIYVNEAKGDRKAFYVVQKKQEMQITRKSWTIFSPAKTSFGEWEHVHYWRDYEEIWTFTVPKGTVFMAGQLKQTDE